MNAASVTLLGGYGRLVLRGSPARCHMKAPTAAARGKVQPIKLSYASYQNTQSYGAEPAAPVVVMHGLFGSKGNWNSLCKAMLQRTRPQRAVFAVDARNHGESPHSPDHTYDHLAADVRQLLTDLKISKTALLGHSMGGRAMMMVALKHPQLVERLVVGDISPVSSSSSLNSLFHVCKALKAIRLENGLPLSAARVQADVQLQRAVPDRGVRTFLLTNLVQRADGSVGWRLNLDAIIHNYGHVMAFPDVGRLRFEGPTLFVSGGSSDYVQSADRPRIRDMFPRAEFHIVEGAGHWLHTEQPEQFLRAVCAFLDRTDTAAAAAT